MKNNNRMLMMALVAVLAFGFFSCSKPDQSQKEVVKSVMPVMGSIETIISTTGTVLPKNRLELKSPVSGRAEEILVKEGEHVSSGQVLARISSTERAALLDAARGQNEEAVKYWKDVYKPIVLISPIEGDVIVSTTQPGQTVSSSDAVIVLSDKLIVRAQVDETDIGKIRLGQKAVVDLDAYPDTHIDAQVEHIYYESQTVNNVTIYKVDLLPEKAPAFFRSGMNATINFIETHKDNVLLVPVDAVIREGDQAYVLVEKSGQKEPQNREVTIGIADDRNIEIVSGLELEETVLVKK